MARKKSSTKQVSKNPSAKKAAKAVGKASSRSSGKAGKAPASRKGATKVEKKKKLRIPKSSEDEHSRHLYEEIVDFLEEELEHDLEEIFEERVAKKFGHKVVKQEVREHFRGLYFRELRRLQIELVKLQDWVQHEGKKIVIIFEGRDAAGKGGTIKRITQRLNPRICRTVALPAPSDREKTQWYFQRYVPHLPAAGEIVLFDRSWYNRSGVERVMGFAKPREVTQFFNDVGHFERMLVSSGIQLIKYWFSISDEEQEFRFQCRILDPLKQWKLSPMDLESRIRWEDYTKAKEATFRRTNFDYAPWYVVPGDDKKKARLNCIQHLLTKVPYRDVELPEVVLPERVHKDGYRRNRIPRKMIIPQWY